MHRVAQCLVCGQGSLRHHFASFAPFIAKRIWNRDPFRIGIMKCRRCKFVFAESRLDPDEEKRLYAGYRGSEYQAMRQSFEPWYTKKLNARLLTGAMEKRRQILAEIFRQHLPSDIKSILDFRGGRGELFQGLFTRAATNVYDISGIEPAPGVRAIRSLAECINVKFDFIGCSNVLQRAASPVGLIADIRRVASPHTVIFIEVPKENPLRAQNYAKRFAQELVLLALRPKLAASMLPFAFLRQVHETVNFFSLRTLITLMEKEGFQIRASGEYASREFSLGPFKLLAGGTAWVLAGTWRGQNA